MFRNRIRQSNGKKCPVQNAIYLLQSSRRRILLACKNGWRFVLSEKGPIEGKLWIARYAGGDQTENFSVSTISPTFHRCPCFNACRHESFSENASLGITRFNSIEREQWATRFAAARRVGTPRNVRRIAKNRLSMIVLENTYLRQSFDLIALQARTIWYFMRRKEEKRKNKRSKNRETRLLSIRNERTLSYRLCLRRSIRRGD